MRGETCSHASSQLSSYLPEEVAPDRAAFLVALDGLLEIVQNKRLIPIAEIGGMDGVEGSALSLRVAHLRYWVYWKNPNQCW